MRVAGVDEAGRGCVIGPMVIAGALFDEEKIPVLKEIGVKDSKKLSPKKRFELDKKIRDIAIEYILLEVPPRVIDHVVFRSKPLRRLNYLETMLMAKIIRELKPDIVRLDPPDVNSVRCREQIQSVLKFNPKIICEPKADDRYLSTGAASILAKVRRDQIVVELCEKYGDFNSGYASDGITQKYIEEYFRENKECPDYMRESWVTVQRYMKTASQMKLTPWHDPSQKDLER